MQKVNKSSYLVYNETQVESTFHFHHYQIQIPGWNRRTENSTNACMAYIITNCTWIWNNNFLFTQYPCSIYQYTILNKSQSLENFMQYNLTNIYSQTNDYHTEILGHGGSAEMWRQGRFRKIIYFPIIWLHVPKNFSQKKYMLFRGTQAF